MPRWYAAAPYKSTKGRDTLVAEIAQLVRNYDLGQVLPLIRFERGAKSEFYLFLAIESETPGELPPALKPLSKHPIFQNLVRSADNSRFASFDLDTIKRMAGPDISVQDYARRLTKPMLEPPIVADPFPPDDGADEVAADELLALSQRHDRLLLWLSAAGSGSLTVAARACRALGLDRDGSETGRILRRLRLLGHAERSAEGSRWAIAPPVLARVAGALGEAGYVLCGARDGMLLSELRRLAAVDEQPQPGGAAPARVYVTTEDAEGLARELQARGIVPQLRVDAAAARLADALPSLEQWQSTLGVVPNIQPAQYDVRRYERGAFIKDIVDRSGFYELWPLEGQQGTLARRPAYRLFYDATRKQWLAGDWYGLRYLARVHEGERCTAHYDLLSATLAIPEDFRPPELYERALVLSSGHLPRRFEGWLRYSDVELSVVDTLAAKLHLSLEGLPDA